jgi:tripartite-type tricarboxylate transporter receptor subunit TctC
MSLLRRRFLHLTAGAAALPMTAHWAKAEAFPVRPVHIVVGFPAGGVADIAARLIGQPLQQRMGQPVVIDNRTGAGGNIGAEVVVRSPPDGYTLTLAGANNSINATLFKTLPFDFIRDIAMVAGIMRGPFIMVVNPAMDARNVTDFIAYAKANPGKTNFGSGGSGTVTHLAGELFKMMAGVDLVHVPYRGEVAALTDLMAGRVQVVFANLSTCLGLVRDGRLRALAVTTSQRWPTLPEIPPVGAVLPGYDVSGWFGLGAPKATPAATVSVLNGAVSASLAEPAVVKSIRAVGAEPMVMSAGELDAFVAADTAKWAKAVKFSGAKVD